MTNNFVFEADLDAKKIHITREFNAPVEKVWKAWTIPSLLDQWWSPKPNKAETKSMDFTVGGIWQFAMVTPDGNKNWLCAKFTGIETGSTISTTAIFCDTDGNLLEGDSKWHRVTKFSPVNDNRTEIDIVITFEEEATFKMFTEGYFKQGTAIGYNQLDELLASDQL
jgi:uncharacterized protein YndB with AHSA1/START domain